MDWFRTLVTPSPLPPVNAMTKNDQDRDSMARARGVAYWRKEAAREKAEGVAAAAYRKVERAAATLEGRALAAAERARAAAAERSERKFVMPSTATKEGPGRMTQKKYKTLQALPPHPKMQPYFDPYEDY